MKQDRILITGANGQIGTVLTQSLRARYGAEQVVATDIVARTEVKDGEIFEILDILDERRFAQLVEQYQVRQVYHLAAILSAKGEAKPLQTWDINMKGLFNVLELAREHQLKVFFPSSIAVFGTEFPKEQTPQYAPLFPTTVYGISKAAGENWCSYYRDRYGIDIRSLRYPGIIGHQSDAGGGTTDYAVEIYHAALRDGRYECFLSDQTTLPMIYMDDAIRATIELMDAPLASLKTENSYNLAGISFCPADIVAEIQKHIPEFTISYQPDFRQKIADSWPHSIDDSAARNDWQWQAEYDLARMTEDMLLHLRKRYAVLSNS
ncbi:MAG: NAD-dependent epimerase/dehydratase family protein [Bacteroidota bacterium]